MDDLTASRIAEERIVVDSRSDIDTYSRSRRVPHSSAAKASREDAIRPFATGATRTFVATVEIYTVVNPRRAKNIEDATVGST